MKTTTIKSTRQAGLLVFLAVGMIVSADVDRSRAEPQSSGTAPTLRLARGEDGKATLAFTPVAGATAYAVRVATGDGKDDVIEDVEVVDYSVHGLTNGRDYRFAVCAVFDGRKGPWSNELSARPVDQPGWEMLREAFASANPTRNSNPFTMVHGQETEAELREILRVAYDAGFEGVTLHPYNYEDYLGPGQWERWKIVLNEARRLGLVVWQQDDRNYPSGYAAGKVVAAHPEFGRTAVATAAHHALTGPQKDFSVDIQSLLQGRDFLLAVTAYPENGDPVDLTDRVAEGKFAWDVPEGKWNLFVMKAVWSQGGAYSDAPDPSRPFIDFLNPQAVDAYIQVMYQAAFDQFGAEFGRTFKGCFTDEPPMEFSQFTPDFVERFEKAKGYSIRKYLPSLFHDLGHFDRKVRVDYYDFIREQNATVFLERSRKWCRDHGIQLTGHVIEDHLQDMRMLESLDIPGGDNVFGQWYDPDPDVYWRVPRMISSVAHYAGSRNDIALIEHFAATGWRTGLSEMKRMMDWTTVMGLNQVVPCGLDTASPPSWEVTPDFWLHGKNPQWPTFREYQAVANRMTMMMRGGRHVAPAIVLDTTQSQWAARGPVRRGFQHGATDDLWRVCEAMCQAHVDFDLIPPYVFTNVNRTAFDNDRVRIGKEDYRVVVLPGVEFIAAATVERLREFYDAGGIVVAIDRLPTGSWDEQENARVRAAVDAIWGAGASKRGTSAMKSYNNLEGYLSSLNVPEVKIPAELKQLLFCHRQFHGKDLYFFDNTGAEPIAAVIELRGVVGVPSLWDAVSGKIIEAPSYANQDNSVKLLLDLGEYESVFIVVDPEGSRQDSLVVIPPRAEGVVLPEPWLVRNGSDEHHRRFSTEAQLPADWRAGSPTRLELKGASQILRVEVNGKPAGQRFCPPYNFEVGEHLHAGSNRIDIERVGRYSSPVEITNLAALSYTDDNKAMIPCQQATLVPRTRSSTNR